MKIHWENRTYIITVSILLLSIIIFPIYSSYTYNKTLENDTDRLYQTAKQLGYKESDYLNYRHVYSNGIDASYDVLELLFVTNLTPEEFKNKVNRLPLDIEEGSSTLEDTPNYLYYSFDELKKYLELKDLNNEQQYPTLTRWLYIFEPKSKKTWTVSYAQSGENEQWYYNNSQIDGNIVQLEFKRR